MQRIRRALSVAPAVGTLYNTQAEILRAAGRLDEAIASYRRACEHDTALFVAHYNLGRALHYWSSEQVPEAAVSAYEAAIAAALQGG